MLKQLIWFHWDTNIGEVLACASSPEAAREQVMATLPPQDAARSELQAAIAPEPKVLAFDKPKAFVVWET